MRPVIIYRSRNSFVNENEVFVCSLVAYLFGEISVQNIVLIFKICLECPTMDVFVLKSGGNENKRCT
jgi:ferredoxin-like protein FixX